MFCSPHYSLLLNVDFWLLQHKRHPLNLNTYWRPLIMYLHTGPDQLGWPTRQQSDRKAPRPPHHLWGISTTESTPKETGACLLPDICGFLKKSASLDEANRDRDDWCQLVGLLQMMISCRHYLAQLHSFLLSSSWQGVLFANFREVDKYLIFFRRFFIICYLSMHSPTLLLSPERDTVMNWHWGDLCVEWDVRNIQQMSRPGSNS